MKTLNKIGLSIGWHIGNLIDYFAYFAVFILIAIIMFGVL